MYLHLAYIYFREGEFRILGVRMWKHFFVIMLWQTGSPMRLKFWHFKSTLSFQTNKQWLVDADFDWKVFDWPNSRIANFGWICKTQNSILKNLVCSVATYHNLCYYVEKEKLKCQRGICPWPSHVNWPSTLKIVVVGIRFWPPYPTRWCGSQQS